MPIPISLISHRTPYCFPNGNFRQALHNHLDNPQSFIQNTLSASAPAILFRIVQKFKMAANLERIQQQMQTELEKFKAVQKGTLWLVIHLKSLGALLFENK